MIWIPNDRVQHEESSPLISHIRQVIAENCAGIPDLDEPRIHELASAVALHAKDSAVSGMYVDSGYLVMLASRALVSIGQRKAAHRLLVFGTGLVKPSEWEIRGGESIWTLDLGRMIVRTGASLELVFFNSLNIVIECVAEVWDATDGRGTLGVRHVGLAVSAILQSRQKRRREALVDEIYKGCRAKLKQVGALRGWLYVPELLTIDE